jgi:hypothetical protein
MQGKDIEINGVYKAEIEFGVKNAKVRVLQKGLAVRSGYGGAKNNGVEVELLQPVARPWGDLKSYDAGTKFMVTTRNVAGPWTDADQAKHEADWQKVERARHVRDRLQALGFKIPTTRTGVQLGMDDIERLLDLAEPLASPGDVADVEAARARFRGKSDEWIIGELERRLAAAHRETQALKGAAEDVAITRADQAARDDAAALEGDVR